MQVLGDDSLRSALTSISYRTVEDCLRQLVEGIGAKVKSVEFGLAFQPLWTKWLLRPVETALGIESALDTLRSVDAVAFQDQDVVRLALAGCEARGFKIASAKRSNKKKLQAGLRGIRESLGEAYRRAYALYHGKERLPQVDIALYCYARSHFPTLLSIACSAREMGLSPCIVFSLSGMVSRRRPSIGEFISQAREKCIAFNFLERFWSSAENGAVRELTHSCEHLIPDKMRSLFLPQPYVREFLSIVGEKMREMGRYHASLNSTALRSLTALHPRAVVNPTRVGLFPHLLHYHARRLGISALVAQHAFLNPIFFRVIAGDVLAAWGESTRSSLIAAGLDSSRVFVAGAPHLDLAIHRPKQLRQGMRLAYMTQAEDKITGVITPRHKLDMLAILDNALNKFDDLEVIVKLHPDDGGAIESDWVNKRFPRACFAKESSALEVILDTDFVYTAYSSTGMEAIFLGHPVIYFANHPIASRLRWHESGLAFPVREPNEVVAAMKEAKKCKNEGDKTVWKQWVHDNFFSNDGGAASRVVGVALGRIECNASRSVR